jgi:hypothetical protein
MWRSRVFRQVFGFYIATFLILITILAALLPMGKAEIGMHVIVVFGVSYWRARSIWRSPYRRTVNLLSSTCQGDQVCEFLL